MRKTIVRIIGCAILLAVTIEARATAPESSKSYYQQAFSELQMMLEGEQPADFERAVFVSENTHWDNQYSYQAFQIIVNEYLSFVSLLTESNDQGGSIDFGVKVKPNGRFKVDDLLFTESEKETMYQNTLGNWAIFKFITDTTAMFPYKHYPFLYATHDPFGMKDWANTQVFNLLDSEKNTGNCFALTALYKILADRMGIEANICTAPQHIYIQHKDMKGDWYNVELATAGHPGDGKIQTLTYSTNQAVTNGISLRSLDEKQSIGLCVVNLAKSYEHRFETKEDDFILQCADLVLKHDSLNLNALLLKQQVLDARVTNYALNHSIEGLYHLRQDQKIAPTLILLEKHLADLYRLGYVQMPLYMQEIVLNGFKDNRDILLFNKSKNASPFTTVQPKDEEDAKVIGVSGGMFQEMFEPQPTEKYGHFTYSNTTGGIVSMDVQSKTDFIIDPVAFAYDFGARMYDARLGRFTSIDPKAAKYPGWSPYVGMLDNPIIYVDKDGRDAILIVFPDYKVDPELKVTVWGKTFKSPKLPLGHAGVLLIDNKTGVTKYYEYGRYTTSDGTRGKVKKVTIYNVKIGEDGSPTTESLNKVLGQISKKSGQGGRIQGAYIKSDQFDAQNAYAQNKLKESNPEYDEYDQNRTPYDVKNNNCGTFACDVIGQDETVDQPTIYNPTPNNIVGEYIEEGNAEVNYNPTSNATTIGTGDEDDAKKTP